MNDKEKKKKKIIVCLSSSRNLLVTLSGLVVVMLMCDGWVLVRGRRKGRRRLALQDLDLAQCGCSTFGVLEKSADERPDFSVTEGLRQRALQRQRNHERSRFFQHAHIMLCMSTPACKSALMAIHDERESRFEGRTMRKQFCVLQRAHDILNWEPMKTKYELPKMTARKTWRNLKKKYFEHGLTFCYFNCCVISKSYAQTVNKRSAKHHWKCSERNDFFPDKCLKAHCHKKSLDKSGLEGLNHTTPLYQTKPSHCSESQDWPCPGSTSWRCPADWPPTLPEEEQTDASERRSVPSHHSGNTRARGKKQ